MVSYDAIHAKSVDLISYLLLDFFLIQIRDQLHASMASKQSKWNREWDELETRLAALTRDSQLAVVQYRAKILEFQDENFWLNLRIKDSKVHSAYFAVCAGWRGTKVNSWYRCVLLVVERDREVPFRNRKCHNPDSRFGATTGRNELGARRVNGLQIHEQGIPHCTRTVGSISRKLSVPPLLAAYP